jgi:glycosyltransferase involved in cell wall biosynthesis
MFSGLPHYYNFVLNRLNDLNGVEIVVVIPESKSDNIGNGVHQSEDNINFKYIQLKEYKTYYGKTFLTGFSSLIDSENPDIVISIWPYILGFIFYPSLRKKFKSKNIKLSLKDIPFRIPKFKDGLKFKNSFFEDENLNYYPPNLTRYLSNIFTTLLRKKYYNIVDAHINYVEEAIDILGSYGVEKEKVFVTFNSPDTENLFSVNEEIKKLEPILPDNPFRIIHIGRLVKWKKVNLLIKAFLKVKEKIPAAELIIIGTGPEKENLEQLTKELNLQDSISFMGGIYSNNILGQYLLSSSIYVLAGMGGLSINEAMCFGKPVICSVCDGTEKHLVFDEYNGKYFVEDSEIDLADKIIYLLSDPQKIKTMGENSLKIIREKININMVIGVYLSAFNYLTGKVAK